MDDPRFPAFTAPAQYVARLTGAIALSYGYPECTNAHLFGALLASRHPPLLAIYRLLGIDRVTCLRELAQLLKLHAPRRRARPFKLRLSPDLKEAIDQAKLQGKSYAADRITPELLLLGMAVSQYSWSVRRRAPLGRLIQGLRIAPDSIANGIELSRREIDASTRDATVTGGEPSVHG